MGVRDARVDGNEVKGRFVRRRLMVNTTAIPTPLAHKGSQKGGGRGGSLVENREKTTDALMRSGGLRVESYWCKLDGGRSCSQVWCGIVGKFA